MLPLPCFLDVGGFPQAADGSEEAAAEAAPAPALADAPADTPADASADASTVRVCVLSGWFGCAAASLVPLGVLAECSLICFCWQFMFI